MIIDCVVMIRDWVIWEWKDMGLNALRLPETEWSETE